MTLLRGGDVDEAEALTGVTPLMRAAEEGHWHMCQLLLNRTADVDRRSIGGSNALTMAVSTVCERCHLTSDVSRSSQPACRCPRLDIARLLVARAEIEDLPQAFAAATRMALQDASYLPMVAALVRDRGLPVDAALCGPDARRGTALSVALERRVTPVERFLENRTQVVSALLGLRADPTRPGPYVAWWGGAPTDDLVDFAIANRCDQETVALLKLLRNEDK